MRATSHYCSSPDIPVDASSCCRFFRYIPLKGHTRQSSVFSHTGVLLTVRPAPGDTIKPNNAQYTADGRSLHPQKQPKNQPGSPRNGHQPKKDSQSPYSHVTSCCSPDIFYLRTHSFASHFPLLLHLPNCSHFVPCYLLSFASNFTLMPRSDTIPRPPFLPLLLSAGNIFTGYCFFIVNKYSLIFV